MSNTQVPSGKKRNHDAVVKKATAETDENEKKKPKSLLVLASRASAKYLKDLRSNVPNEGENRILARKMELRRQLEELEDEKHDFIAQRHLAIDDIIANTTEGFTLAGEPDRYCRKCNNFFREEKENSCIVVGCQSHKECLKCQVVDRQYKYKNTLHKDALYRDYSCREQGGFPSESGYVKCWICKDIVCNNHFANSHYHDCRQKIGNNCGFKPPGSSFVGPGCICVPGHCGRKLTKEDDFFICYEDEDICDTLTCGDCAVECTNVRKHYFDRGCCFRECGNDMCKQCRCWLCD